MKNIFQKIVNLILLSFLFITIEASNSIIVLSQKTTQESINKELERSKHIVIDKINFNTTIEELPNYFILKTDPFLNSKNLTIAYLVLKESFPKAFILEVENNLHKNLKVEKIFIEKDNQLLWIAIFTLALIGILGLFSSSIQIKNIIIKHSQMQEKQNKIENFLTNIGENIYALSKKSMNYKKNSNRASIDKKLFDTSRVMIHFLRLKCKNVKIIQEKFNLNNLLNGILGTISHTFEESDIELIFEVENSVPKNIIGDPLHLSEILIELLQNAMKYTNKGEVKLHIYISSLFSSQDKLYLEVSDTGIGISDKHLEMLFIPSYTQTGEYKGLGLYVANELTSLMNGELTIVDSTDKGTTFLCSLPLLSNLSEDRRIYRLPDETYTKKSVLIYDSNENAALAIKKMFVYFNINAEIISPQKFNTKSTNLSKYDIILLDMTKLNKSKITTIRNIRKEKSLKIVHLSSCFSTKRYVAHDYVDDWIEKPISQERIYELLLNLFDTSSKRDITKESIKKLKVVKPDNLIETKNITTNNFVDFKDYHLLIVEDNIIDQKVMKGILGKGGMKITIANNGKEAIEKLEEEDNSFDLILMDISMPIMDGYETIEQIRNNEKFDTLPIVSLTSLALDNDVKKMFRVGSNAYIRKPLKIGYLYSVLNHFLGTDEKVSISNIETKESISTQDGLDVNIGIEHANGSQELYNEVLDEFLNAYGNSAESLKLWVKDNRYEQIKRLCLDMKGLTGAIGAYKMFELVDTMHKQFLYNNIHLIPKFIESYEKELAKLIKTIRIYMDDI